MAGARTAALVRAGQAAAELDAARDGLLRRGRGDLGPPLRRRGNRHAAGGPRLAPDGERDAPRVRAGVAVLLLVGGRERRPGQAAGAVRRVLRRAARERRARPLDRGARAGLVVRGGAIMHRYGLGSWQRGREVIWAKAFAALQLPVYLTIHGTGICEPGAGRWLDSTTFVFNEGVVANEEG